MRGDPAQYWNPTTVNDIMGKRVYTQPFIIDRKYNLDLLHVFSHYEEDSDKED